MLDPARYACVTTSLSLCLSLRVRLSASPVLCLGLQGNWSRVSVWRSSIPQRTSAPCYGFHQSCAGLKWRCVCVFVYVSYILLHSKNKRVSSQWLRGVHYILTTVIRLFYCNGEVEDVSDKVMQVNGSIYTPQQFISMILHINIITQLLIFDLCQQFPLAVFFLHRI